MKFHSLLKSHFTKWEDLEKEIEKLPTTKQRGDVFEEFIYCYLELKKNLYQIESHYMTKDIPTELKRKYELEKNDCGVDGLIVFRKGKIGAYQVKFRSKREKPSYDELTKFWAEARHTDLHYTIANCYGLTNLSAKNKNILQFWLRNLMC